MMPVVDPYQGSLTGVPQAYQHERCGAITKMPEEIIRGYLGNPFLYGRESFCGGCLGFAPYRELRWQETGQTLSDYFAELQGKFLREFGLDRRDIRKRYIDAAILKRRANASQRLVEITRAGATRIREIVKWAAIREPWWARVVMKVPLISARDNYVIDIETAPDRCEDVVDLSQGIKTVVAKEYAEMLRGVQIDYREGGDGPAGFAIDTPFPPD